MTNQQGAPEALRFTKKPVTIEAIQWTGKNLREVITFTDGPPDTRSHHAGMSWDDYRDLVARDGLKIYTLEGKMLANLGDWIIRGVKGEYYPCKPDIFEATYSPAPLVEAQQPAPSAAAAEQQAGATKEHLRLVRVIADKIEDGTLFQSGIYSNKDLARFVRNVADAAAPQPSPTPQADSQPAPDEIISMAREQGLPETEIEGVFRVNVDDLGRMFAADRAARAPADSVTAPAGGGVARLSDDIDAVGLARYKVVPAHESMFHRFAVVAGDGKQQLYLGRETECQNMARKFAGAFLDGAFYQSNIAPTPAAHAADSVLEDAARLEFEMQHGSAIAAARKQGAKGVVMHEPLKDCPFCGGAASLHNDTDSPCWFVGCSNSACPIEPCHYADTEAEAIATWNRRTPTPVAVPLLDAARKQGESHD